MKTIQIDGGTYTLDLDKCIKDGYIKRELEFVVGGVYVDPQGRVNDFLLVQAIYGYADGLHKYALLGNQNGFGTNSGVFFERLHTEDEIIEHLTSRGMILSHRASIKKP